MTRGLVPAVIKPRPARKGECYSGAENESSSAIREPPGCSEGDCCKYKCEEKVDSTPNNSLVSLRISLFVVIADEKVAGRKVRADDRHYPGEIHFKVQGWRKMHSHPVIAGYYPFQQRVFRVVSTGTQKI